VLKSLKVGSKCCQFDDFFLRGAFEGFSYKATDQKGDIIGVTLNEMVSRVRINNNADIKFIKSFFLDRKREILQC
jgi:hypothetical protein